MDDFLRKSVADAEKLRSQLSKLRSDPSVEGMIKYNEALLEAVERQHNIYTRLRLMGDQESTDTADEMEHVTYTYLGRTEGVTMSEFFVTMKGEILLQLKHLTPSRFYFDEGLDEDDDWSWV